ncbi:UNVERIFIED_CONTAM: hypothetical protein Sradi_6902600 [Sesamum radiatum]|uniref:At5g58720/SDE5-like UBA-like domain-containing protein n=1 Tax=Sesamum radiatum TaxID=300843 RepID=A0AAW2JIP8_SESRA
MKQSKKKKRSRASSKGNAENHGKIADEKEQGILKNLLEGFASVSVEEAASTYREAASDLSKAAETPTTSAVLESRARRAPALVGITMRVLARVQMHRKFLVLQIISFKMGLSRRVSTN